ncbi:prostacyclin synthase [Pelobates fuscus]|uniref:prostacyclin synthase n=1 Tax=Pelobates fuscus TaxID=191477 RepID=UPI002FE48D45
MLPAIAILLTCLLCALLYVSLFRRTRRPHEPPLDRGFIPWLGHALEFGKDAAKFLSRMKEKHGDIFTVQVAGRFITVLLDPNSYDAVVWESQSRLDFGKYAKVLMERMFDVNLPNYDMTAEKAVLKIHLQNTNLPSLTKSMFYNLNNILGDKMSSAAEWKEEGLFDFTYNVMLRAGYLTLFGSESDQSNSHRNTADIQHSEEVYKEFRKLDQLLMKAARNMLSAEQKKDSASAKSRLWKLLDSEKLKRKAMKSGWIESYQRHLEDARVTPDMQSKAMVLQLWATQGNAGPAAFWMLLFLLKHPKAMTSVQEELEKVFKSNGRTIKRMEDVSQEILDSTIVFDSVLNESLRLTAAPFITREVLLDMSLKLADGREYRLRNGDRLCLFPYVSPQMDPEIHQQPQKFQYDRFLNADRSGKKDFYKNGKKVKHPSMPWGAGSNVCTGRFHAVNSIKLFVFLLFFYFEFKLNNPKDNMPQFDRSRYGFGVLHPDSDIVFRYRKRF